MKIAHHTKAEAESKLQMTQMIQPFQFANSTSNLDLKSNKTKYIPTTV